MVNYANITERFQLPTPGLGDILNPDDESRFAKIIDNQLFGAIRVHSGGDGILRNGELALLNNSDGTHAVIMFENKAAGKPVLEAFINQIYVFTESSLQWSGLADDTTYFLFIQLIETDDNESSLLNKQVVTSFNTTGDVPADGSSSLVPLGVDVKSGSSAIMFSIHYLVVKLMLCHDLLI